MKILILIFLPALLIAEFFPSNSPDFTAYGIGFGSGEAGYLLTNLFTDDPYLRIIGGIGGSIIAHAIFNSHFSTDGEQNWVGVGRTHWIGIRISYDVLNNLMHKKKHKATALLFSEENNKAPDEIVKYKSEQIDTEDYDELIEYGLEQLGG